VHRASEARACEPLRLLGRGPHLGLRRQLLEAAVEGADGEERRGEEEEQRDGERERT
jgi:hypothetical protein